MIPKPDCTQLTFGPPADFLTTLNRRAPSNPNGNRNFLKKAFLDACDRAGLFSQRAEEVNG